MNFSIEADILLRGNEAIFYVSIHKSFLGRPAWAVTVDQDLSPIRILESDNHFHVFCFRLQELFGHEMKNSQDKIFPA